MYSEISVQFQNTLKRYGHQPTLLCFLSTLGCSLAKTAFVLLRKPFLLLNAAAVPFAELSCYPFAGKLSAKSAEFYFVLFTAFLVRVVNDIFKSAATAFNNLDRAYI